MEIINDEHGGTVHRTMHILHAHKIKFIVLIVIQSTVLLYMG